MKIVKQKTSLKIDNNDLVDEKHIKHSALFPRTLRCLIIGPSNCGKANVIISLIEHENRLKFKNVYVYSKSLYQPKYVHLENLLKPIKCIGYYAFNNSENIINPSNARSDSIFIFDDVACDKQDIIREYFSLGRHNKIDCFYLRQTYAKIPKHLIGDNANTFVIFKQDVLNLKHIYNDHIGTDMNYEKFRNLCTLCWKIPFGFLCIFKDNDINKGRYRKGFDHFIYLDEI
jgi:GTPase SAR1 family protein